jgi:hypothetical protein
MIDEKRELFRHLLATVAFRARVALADAPAEFAAFKFNEGVRTPAEILAHMGDLLEGTLFLLKGEMVYLNSAPLAWHKETERFFNAARALDAYLAADAPLAHPLEKIMQGPIADALTHVGQIVILRRAAGSPIQPEPYFTAEITKLTENGKWKTEN